MSRTIVVVGAGVIGITTAIRLLEANFRVVVLAKDLPGDDLIPTYASPCAGAHHLSFAADDDALQRKLDHRTFDTMWEQIHTPKHGDEEQGAALMKLTQIEYYATAGEKHIQFFEELPDFKILSPPSHSSHSVSFTSMTMDTVPYLSALVNRFKKLGGTLNRANLPSLKSALEQPVVGKDRVDAVVNCTGLGSLHLSDVADETMYPIRGHVIVLNAPWIKEGRTRQVGSLAASEVDGSDGGEGGERTYIIPRKSGQVVIGGTREVADWSTIPDPLTTLSIKRRALELFPNLSPLYDPSSSSPPEPEELDAIVIREVIGFRPARRDGLRLERGDDILSGEGPVRVFHNYGHSGAGWQACWGCAEQVVQLLRESYEKEGRI